MNKESILLINENALPDNNVPFYPAALDMIKMGVFASQDRTAAQLKSFSTLLGSS
jgi:hypothetical protein